MDKPLVFIHLSDIHFNKKWCDHFDLDKDVRDQLEKDVIAMRKRLPAARGILVTGDIAFGGKKDDYDEARAWLKKLCELAGCREQDVWCVPGNHDVDRHVFDNSLIIRRLHDHLRVPQPEQVDDHLTECLRDSAGAIELFRPIENYNNFFASKFSCPSGPNLFWVHALSLNDGSTLKIFGANSTLVSDKDDNNADKRLILGGIQSTPPEIAGVTYLFLCHHPPDWLRDYESVNMNLDARAKVQLFGHKHVQALEERNGCVRLVAGAVHPSRKEGKWKPRYNWLLLSVSGIDDSRALEVDIYPRAWNDARPEYIADTGACSGQDHRVVKLSLPPWTAPVATPSSPSSVPTALPTTSVLSMNPSVPESKAGAVEMDAARTLTYRFLSLSHVTRLEIAQKLQLLDNSDEGLMDFELFGRIFKRAVEKKQLEKLWEMVEEAHNDGQNPSNPYVGQ
jgi:predicted MPP superfamily phosphohydrolase